MYHENCCHTYMIAADYRYFVYFFQTDLGWKDSEIEFTVYPNKHDSDCSSRHTCSALQSVSFDFECRLSK